MALGKQPLCRVPDKKHSTKSGTLDKETVSGSDIRKLGMHLVHETISIEQNKEPYIVNQAKMASLDENMDLA